MNLSSTTWKVTLLVSLFITVFGNFSFWGSLTDVVSFKQEPLLIIGFFVVLLSLINLLFTLLSFKPVFKLVLILTLMVSASAAYFMDNYAVMIDRGMIRNVLATDVNEATELFSIRYVLTLLLLGVLPSFLILKTTISYQPVIKGLLQKSAVITICFVVMIGTFYSNFQELSFFSRNNRELKHLINPVNYIMSLKSVISSSIVEGNIIVKPIENDAKKTLLSTQNTKPSLTILVLGETARSMNFSLNGYKRDTNPLLAKQDIVNFKDVSSCGTATAVSVPCLFSKFSRSDFSNFKGKQYENLIDVINHAGYEVLWRDNNTGCQGSCERVAYETLAHSDSPKYCEGGNCVDEILLDGLQEIVDKNSKDKFIILHQKGNHGPTYHRRYPKRFEVFKPACKTNQLRSCSKEEVINAYDNAILYSDYFLDKTISLLKQNSEKYNTAMVYISDHGESLGENNIFLHGLPYLIAPDYQKKVPFIVWLSKQYQYTYGINKPCLANKSLNTLSHDNIFSSMLGLLAVETNVYDSNLDVFDSCTSTQMAHSLLHE